MADYYVDSGATGLNDGTSPTDAWTSIKTAYEYASYAAGDNIWVRRTYAGDFTAATADILPTDDGTRTASISIIGWPRPSIPNTTITEASWTNGSSTVDLIVGITASETQHVGRYCTAPDGKQYLITRVVDTNTIMIDRPYPGTTVTGTSGAFSIAADEDYSSRPTAGQTAGWDSDAIDLPYIDFGTVAYQLYFYSAMYWHNKNIQFKNGTDSYGTVSCVNGRHLGFTGCLFTQTQDAPCLRPNYSTFPILQRCIFIGSGTGTSQNLLYADGTDAMNYLKDCAIYNAGNYGIRNFQGWLYNVNVGVEQANGNYDISFIGDRVIGKDVKLGGTNGYIELQDNSNLPYDCFVGIENYGKEIGTHIKNINYYQTSPVDVVLGSGDPEKRSGGADTVLKIESNSTSAPVLDPIEIKVFDHSIEADATSKSYRYYVQSTIALTASELWIEVEYLDSYSSDTAYTKSVVKSTSTVAARTSASDWTQYIEVTGIQPATASKVRISLRCNKNIGALEAIYVDPMVVIS